MIKITKQVIKEIKSNIDRWISVGGSYHIVSSYGYGGIEWGTVKVLGIVPYVDVPDIEKDAWSCDGMESEWLEDPWVQYEYTDKVGCSDNSESLGEGYMTAELFIRHTVAP